MEDTAKKPPIKVFRCGPVKAAIWLNNVERDGEVVAIHSIRVDKIYKDKNDNEWKHTNSFGAEDLPKVTIVANEAYKFIRLRTSEQNDADEIEPGRE